MGPETNNRLFCIRSRSLHAVDHELNKESPTPKQGKTHQKHQWVEERSGISITRCDFSDTLCFGHALACHSKIVLPGSRLPFKMFWRSKLNLASAYWHPPIRQYRQMSVKFVSRFRSNRDEQFSSQYQNIRHIL